MRQTFIHEPHDMEWLHAVHKIRASSAVIYGNEDAPLAVEAYETADPQITDKPTMYRPSCMDGKLEKAGA